MESINNAIAVVGVYFALMAVLAVAVEAIVGWLKLPPKSPLHGKPSLDDVLNEVKDWLPAGGTGGDSEVWKARITALNKALVEIGQTELTPNATLEDVVRTIGEAATRHFHQERNRRALIRVVAIVLGFLLAWAFQIDTLALLAPFSSSAQELLQDALGVQGPYWVGLALSGLAASAGSSFWHDQSARLRGLKDVAGKVKELAETIQ